MTKYKLHRDIPTVGKSGDIVSLNSIDNIPFNSKLELVETDEVERKLNELEKESDVDSERISEVVDSGYIVTDKNIYRKKASGSKSSSVKDRKAEESLDSMG